MKPTEKPAINSRQLSNALILLMLSLTLSACASKSRQRNGATAQIQTNLPKGSCVVQTRTPLDNAKECLGKARAGDADAMWQLSVLLGRYGPVPGDPKDIEKMNLWKNIGNRYQSIIWANKAAQKGSVAAIRFKCSLKDDTGAPRLMREDAQRWCDKLKKN